MTHAAFACATLVLAATAGVAARGEDTPPPKVTVAAPVEQMVTSYLEATGNTAACQLGRSRCNCDRMAEARKIAKYTFDALLVFVPLAVVLYFLAYPDRFNAFLNWIFGHR